MAQVGVMDGLIHLDTEDRAECSLQLLDKYSDSGLFKLRVKEK